MVEDRSRIIKILAEVMKTRAEELKDAEVLTEINNWDSLNHLNFVTRIEKEFGIRFDIQEVTMISSVSQTLSLIQSKQV